MIGRCLSPGIAVAIVLALATVAGAESSLETIRARGVLRVGVKSDAPPFGSLDALGRPVGFEIDLARLFARVLFDDDRRVELVPVTTATRFGVLQGGRVDLVAATITATDEPGANALAWSYTCRADRTRSARSGPGWTPKPGTT